MTTTTTTTPAPTNEDEILTGEVTRLVRSFPDTGYTILNLMTAQRQTATVVGILPGAAVGDRLELRGRWTTHEQYGRQFKASTFERRDSASVDGLAEYLGSGAFRGIGPVLAGRIVEAFGAATLEILDEHPDRLARVPGIGPQRAAALCEAWRAQRPVQTIMTFLQGHGLSSGLAAKIHQRYKDQSEAIIRQNPFRLIDDIAGIGFRTADQLAQRLGLAMGSPERLRAGLLYALDQFTQAGHVYAPQVKWLESAAGLLQASEAALLEQIKPLTVSGKAKIVYAEGEPIAYPGFLYRHETTVAARLRAIRRSDGAQVFLAFRAANFEQLIGAAIGDGLPLTAQQQAAVRSALIEKITVLTGGPGTGKTSSVKALLALCERYGVRFALCAPTGRAAKRLAETTSRPASTIHRLLEWKGAAEGGRFGRNNYFPLDVDLLVIDEASMLDLTLANYLFDAVPNRAHVLLVGDVDQLPPVGAGNVLRDLIGSELGCVIRLDVIFRQSEHSVIVSNAHRINQGELPLFPPDAVDSFFFVQDDARRAADLVVDLVQRRIPARFGFNPHDIMVLAPMHRGDCGTVNLNAMLQSALNPASPSTPSQAFGAKVFRVGDRVMQLSNDYELDVFNGDVGCLVRIDAATQTLIVDVDGRLVEYARSKQGQLALAYAGSVHKSQGSEYPVVVLPLLMEHALLLQRNLLYTGITRAKKLAVLVGSRRALALAVRHNPIAQRYSLLAARLRGEF